MGLKRGARSSKRAEDGLEHVAANTSMLTYGLIGVDPQGV